MLEGSPPSTRHHHIVQHRGGEHVKKLRDTATTVTTTIIAPQRTISPYHDHPIFRLAASEIVPELHVYVRLKAHKILTNPLTIFTTFQEGLLITDEARRALVQSDFLEANDMQPEQRQTIDNATVWSMDSQQVRDLEYWVRASINDALDMELYDFLGHSPYDALFEPTETVAIPRAPYDIHHPDYGWDIQHMMQFDEWLREEHRPRETKLYFATMKALQNLHGEPEDRIGSYTLYDAVIKLLGPKAGVTREEFNHFWLTTLGGEDVYYTIQRKHLLKRMQRKLRPRALPALHDKYIEPPIRKGKTYQTKEWIKYHEVRHQQAADMTAELQFLAWLGERYPRETK